MRLLGTTFQYGDRNSAIDILRVISITLVVFSHYGILEGFFLSGVHGVSIFFMVSGYCMSYSTKNRTGIEFLKARFWRLIPMLVICATLTTIFELSLSDIRPDRLHTVKDYLANLACLPTGNLVCDGIYFFRSGQAIEYRWVDGAYWSILVELRFYMLLWLLCYVFKIRRVHIVLSILGTLAVFDLSTPLISKSQDFALYLSFFSFGMAFRSWMSGEKYAVLSMIIAVMVFILNSFYEVNAISMGLNPSNIFSYLTCFGIFVAVITFFSKACNKIVSFFGVVSYPIYLIHQDAGFILIEIFNQFMPSLVSIVSTVILILLVAVVVQLMIDLSLQKIKRDFR